MWVNIPTARQQGDENLSKSYIMQQIHNLKQTRLVMLYSVLLEWKDWLLRLIETVSQVLLSKQKADYSGLINVPIHFQLFKESYFSLKVRAVSEFHFFRKVNTCRSAAILVCLCKQFWIFRSNFDIFSKACPQNKPETPRCSYECKVHLTLIHKNVVYALYKQGQFNLIINTAPYSVTYS